MIHGQAMKKSQANALGLNYYMTGKPCSKGHWAYRDRFGNCLDCAKDQYDRRRSDRVRHMIRSKRSQCRHFRIEFDLSEKDVHIPEKCPALGLLLDWQGSDNKPTIDRVDPSKGYINGNVRIISARANRIKSDATAGELRLIADYIDSI